MINIEGKELRIINNKHLHQEHVQAGKLAREMALKELIDLAKYRPQKLRKSQLNILGKKHF